MKKKIDKSIKHYEYNGIINLDLCNSTFDRKYKNFTDKDTLKNYTHIIWGVLKGLPNCTHITAKKMIFQGDKDCWKYFERTAVFWTYGHINDIWIDHLKGAYEYALYVEREDLVEMLFEKSLGYLTNKENLSNKEFIKQKVYPSTQLIHFLLAKWTGKNKVKDSITKYGNGYGIYQKIIDNWDDFSKIEDNYWNKLCEYHLNGIGLQRGEKRENEEFLPSGLIPMELINLFKVRKKLGLDIPVINNALFDTNMAKEPLVPTGYNEHKDVKFVLVNMTVNSKKKHTLQEAREYIKNQYGKDVGIFE